MTHSNVTLDNYKSYISALYNSLLKEQTILGKQLDLRNQFVTLTMLDRYDDTKSDLNYLVLGTGRTNDISLDEILSWEIPILIVSGAGSGKTTLLKYIAFSLCENILSSNKVLPRSIPIIIKLKELESSGRNIENFMITIAGRLLIQNDPENFIKYCLSEGLMTILLDGYDEITNNANSLLEQIIAFSSKFSNNRIILTSRPITDELYILSQGNKTNLFREVGISPLSPKKIRDFIKVYSKDIHSASSLIEIIEANKYLSDISTIPINLIILIKLYEDDISLSRKADFYSDAILMLITSWPRRKHHELRYKTIEKYQLLEYISYSVILHDKKFSRKLIVKSQDNFSFNAEDVFEEILDSSGLIRLIHYDEFEFIHRTFMEYLAAKHIVSSGILKEELPSICKRRYIEIFSFICGIVEDSSSIMKYLFQCSPEDLYLIAVCISECRHISYTLQSEAENKIYRYISKSNLLFSSQSDANRILKLLHRFYKNGTKTNLYQNIINMLVSPNEYICDNLPNTIDVKTEALRYIEHMKNPELVDVLINELKPENEIWLRFKAAASLANMGVDRAAEPLLNAYRKEIGGDEDVRRNIVEALIRIGSPEILPFLQCIHVKDSDIIIQQMTEDGIKQINSNKKLIEKICVDFQHDDVPHIQRIYHSRIIPLSELVQLACSKSKSDRLEAFYLLRESEVQLSSLKPFEDLLFDYYEIELYKCETIKVIGQINNEKTNELLLQFYRSFDRENPKKDSNARGYAIEYLGYNKFYKSIEFIIGDDLYYRPDNEKNKSVWAIFEMLRFIGDQTRDLNKLNECNTLILPEMRKLQGDSYYRVRHWAMKIIRILEGIHIE